ncbi:coatomer subunit gamma-2-like [Daphnia carinata]|uniref:coatomer subunit gamma-2-like n=1 Tax=Daphnia carinata TaxID=120202 RepID=UPI0025809A1F|nr:coatomer subunit gamma-2-like [Daphnia carinata]
MMGMKRDKKDEEDASGGNPFHNVEKTAVLQEARIFNETPVKARRCTHVLTKILYLINQGEVLGTTEATEAFFAMTKLFQSKDVVLRRMVYLGIKELAMIAEDVIIVTSSLTKDMTGKEDTYRAPAIRALTAITDNTMLQAIERYMKQAIVDKSPAVSSAALVSSLHLFKTAPEVIKRWVNEAQEALNSDNVMVQYHGLGLLYQIRKTDRLGVTKLVAKLTKMPLKSPYAACHLIRMVCKLIEEEESAGGEVTALMDYLESCLRHKSEMVIYEAAHAIVNLRRTGPRELAPAISVLQLFCSSPKPALRFAAVRTLSNVAMTHPAAVTACNLDLENLITDSNRSIATLAITTLLKTGGEASVDRLMKQIASFVSEISDEFKVVVVEAIRSLGLKYPRKHSTLMSFLSGMLRDEGGLEYKASIADTIIAIVEDNPDAKEAGLTHLCEFIEDCEHTSLAVRILHLLGREGPRTKQPSKYIRFIYNRVILENAAVRAAAVSALAHFGATCEDLLPNILVLLQRSQMDTDDEVRDRATYFYSVLSRKQAALNSQYILEGLQASLVTLEKALLNYVQHPSEAPFDLKSVPLAPVIEERHVAPTGQLDGGGSRATPASVTAPTAARLPATATRQDVYIEKLSAIPQFDSYGPLFKSSAPAELTESETEYVVRCVKHTYAQHMVLQFDCTNTLNDQLLENVNVAVEAPEGFDILVSIPCDKLEYNVLSSCYVALSLPESVLSSTGTCSATLKFTVKDCDPTTGQPDSDDGYEDDYVLEDVEIGVSDHIQRAAKASFGTAWEEMGSTNELQETFSLPAIRTLDEAVRNIISFLGLQPCEWSDKVPEGKSAHTLLLSGVFRGGYEVLVRSKLALSPEGGVTMQLSVRSGDAEVSELVASAVG